MEWSLLKNNNALISKNAQFLVIKKGINVSVGHKTHRACFGGDMT